MKLEGAAAQYVKLTPGQCVLIQSWYVPEQRASLSLATGGMQSIVPLGGHWHARFVHVLVPVVEHVQLLQSLDHVAPAG
jgi:hypothetical protein